MGPAEGGITVTTSAGGPGRPTRRWSALGVIVVVGASLWGLGGIPSDPRDGSDTVDVPRATTSRDMSPGVPAIVGGSAGDERELGWCLGMDGWPELVSGPETGLASLWPPVAAGEPEAWRVTPASLGALAGRPAAAGSLVVVGTVSGDVVGVDRDSGRGRWRADGVGGRSQPWVSDGLVVHHDGDRVVGLVPETGGQRWRTEGDPLRRLVGSVAVHEGRVYAARNREQRERFDRAPVDVVAVFDAVDGTMLDELEVRDPGRSGRPVLLDVTVVGDVLVTLELGGVVVGRDLDDGTPRWRRSVPRSTSLVVGSEFGVAVFAGSAWVVPRGLDVDPDVVLDAVVAATGRPCLLAIPTRGVAAR